MFAIFNIMHIYVVQKYSEAGYHFHTKYGFKTIKYKCCCLDKLIVKQQTCTHVK